MTTKPTVGASSSVIASLDDWRGAVLAEVRRPVHQALPEVVETWTWIGSPVWEWDGIVVGNAHQTRVTLNVELRR